MKTFKRNTRYRYLQNHPHIQTWGFLIFPLFILLFNGCKKNTIDSNEINEVSFHAQECVELVYAQPEDPISKVAIDVDSDLFWIDVTIIKNCDAVLSRTTLSSDNVLRIDYRLNSAMSDKCFCKSKYRSECSRGESSVAVVISLYSEKGELISQHRTGSQ